MDRKSRVVQLQDVQGGGEAVVVYREPMATQQMGCHRLSHRVNKIEIFPKTRNSSIQDV